MYWRLILLFFALQLGIGLAQAQSQLSLSHVDALTQELILKKDWDGLVREGKNALEQGIDYYYLRIRLGIANFEKGNYHQAFSHFEKALETNGEEEYVKEYLYYAYLWSGRTAQAKSVARDFSNKMKLETQTDQASVVNGLEAAYNYTGLSDQQVIDEFSVNVDPSSDGYQLVPRFHHYGFLGLDLNLGARFRLYQGFSLIQATHFYYGQESGFSFQNPSYVSDSWQYFASGSYYMGKGFHFTAGGHYLNINFPLQEVQQMGNGQQALVIIQDQKDSDYLVFGSISKNFAYLDLGASVFYGTINNATQIQSDLNLTLYPPGNLNFYTNSVLTFQNQEFANGSVVNRLIFNQEMGTKVTNFLWLEGYVTFGELENYFTKQGLVVFNRLDKIEQRWGARAIFLPSPKWKITLDYTNFSNSSSFQSPTTSAQEQNLKKYQLQSLTAILSWKF